MSREMELRRFACDCAARALERWRQSGREPDHRSFEVLRIARLVADGKLPISELKTADELSRESIQEYIRSEDRHGDISEQMSWYGAMNAVSAACNQDYENAAEYAAREGRREARRVGDEQREIAWQTKRLKKLRIIDS